MQTESPRSRHDELRSALAVSQRRRRRHARLQVALYTVFSLMTLAGAWVVARALLLQPASLAGAWPALLAQVGGAAALVVLWRWQRRRLVALADRALPVREALQRQLDDLALQRRQSRLLLALAAVAVPALLLAVILQLRDGSLDGAAAASLALLCLLPGIVIGGVHGSRLQRVGRQTAALESLRSEFDAD